MDERRGRRYTPPIVDGNASPRLILLGHLAITVPVIAAVPLVVLWGLYQFGPSLWPYYVTGGLALAWRWRAVALPWWKGLLTSSGLQVNETEGVALRSALLWPGTTAIGSFALHTTAAAVCGIHFGPWLLSRWCVWILPLSRKLAQHSQSRLLATTSGSGQYHSSLGSRCCDRSAL